MKEATSELKSLDKLKWNLEREIYKWIYNLETS